MREPHGEKIYVCPFCNDTDFDEIQLVNENDERLIITKSEVIDFIIPAIIFINGGQPNIAKETLMDLLRDMIGENFLDYKKAIDNLTDVIKMNNLVSEIQESLRTVTV